MAIAGIVNQDEKNIGRAFGGGTGREGVREEVLTELVMCPQKARAEWVA